MEVLERVKGSFERFKKQTSLKGGELRRSRVEVPELVKLKEL